MVEVKTFDPKTSDCVACVEGRINPMNFGGKICVRVGFKGHPGICHLMEDCRVIVRIPCERVSLNTRISGRLLEIGDGLVGIRD